ncbi:MAG: FHA domain-containing protein [Archangium sp.]|nr:FHA domain-containing protein [Archangium sp.]
MSMRLNELIDRWRADPAGTERTLQVPVLVYEAAGVEQGDMWAATGSVVVGRRPHGHDPAIFFVEKRIGTQNPFTMGVTIGRVENNDIAIDDSSVSRFHAWLQHDERTKAWVLCDAESKNGTYLDGVELDAGQRKPLSDGSVIRLGNAYLRFLLPASVVGRLLLLAGA